MVKAFADYAKHVPHRFGTGSCADEQLFVWSSGKPVQRSEVQATPEQAAVACGIPADLIGSHSLRFGGASALWAAFRDTGLVRRWGRWASDQYQSYLWDGAHAASGIAKAMAESDIAVM